ncbi:hypothetical protein LCGC14_0521510 [marine sediment metagenome]|uniref:LamG-like jellyroll fold domain-containing protein n=1 Tax=marine sediment metagenome TaxID=412755 RepID=A0A0F9UJV2_9ZZZZ
MDVGLLAPTLKGQTLKDLSVMFIPGLIGLWRLNEGNGLIARDLSGYGNDGALEGTTPIWVDGISGKAVNFPGVNERIDCGNGSPLDQIGNGSFWIPFWMKSKDAVPLPFGRLFDKIQDGNNWIFFSSDNVSNRLRFYMKKTVLVQEAFSTGSAPFDTEFNHIVLIINRTTDKAIVYVNTVKDSTEIDISSLPIDCSNTGNVSWGARTNGLNPYEGLLDELYVFLGIPTQEQIDYLFNNPGGAAFSYKEKTSNLYTIVDRTSNLFTKKEGDSNL